MRNIEQVSCSLNLGYIFSLDYNYDPSSGTRIRAHFVNERGQYTMPQMLPPRKAFIRIGGASFTMYPIKCGEEYASGRRVIWVEFEDEFHLLNNYYIALPGRGCGTNVFTLGKPVDERSLEAIQSASLDPVATRIASFTQFPDYVYSFNDFVEVLRHKFSVQIRASTDNTIKRDFEGSFLSVLQDWCGYYNLSYFFENGVIKIFDPTTLNISLPDQPPTALSYTREEDITSTYGKTVCNWFQQEGGQYSLSQQDNVLRRTHTLYPIGYEQSLAQTSMNTNQVAASQYGEPFWFLYNYWQGTTSQNCGLTPRPDISPLYSSVKGITDLGGQVATLDKEAGEQKYQAFFEYGQKIAGRWYLTNRLSDVTIDESYTWFGQIYGLAESPHTTTDTPIGVTSLYSNGYLNNQVIDTTIINQYFPGVQYVGDRLAYYDKYVLPSGSFELTAELESEVNDKYNTMAGLQNDAYELNSQLVPVYGNANYVSFVPVQFSQELIAKFQSVESNDVNLLKPRFQNIPIRGTSTSDYVASQSAQENGGSDVSIVTTRGPKIVSNTSVLKTAQRGSYNVYYDKYSTCSHASTLDSYYGYQFAPQQISSDSEIGITFKKNASNTYQLNRDYSFINSLANNPFLKTLAQPRSFPTKRVSYTLNYFESVPIDFLSNGLVGLNVSIGDNGVQATYSYSNEVLRVPDKTAELVKLQQSLRNSWLRQYRPTQVIT